MKRFKNEFIVCSILVLVGIGVIILNDQFNLLSMLGSLGNINSNLYVADDKNSLIVVLLLEAFASIHMAIFVFYPLSKIIGKDKHKKVFNLLFLARIGGLIIGNAFWPIITVICDFLFIFVGAFLIIPSFSRQ